VAQSADQTIIVVGAGVFGASAALELCRRGHAVTLIDPGPLPHSLAASTDISKVIRMDYGADEFYLQLMEQALEGWDAWNRGWEQPLYHQTGVLFLAAGELAEGQFEGDSYALLQRRGHSPEHLSATDLAGRFPAWNTDTYPEGYFNPRGGWAESGEVVAQLIAEGKLRGVKVRAGEPVVEFLEQAGRTVGVRTAGGSEHRADWVVVAAGAWSPVLLPELADFMWPVGQPVLHFHVEEPADYQPPHFAVWTADIANTGWYGFPALADGTLKIANHGPGRRIHPDAPRQVEPEEEERFRRFLRRALPGAAEAPLAAARLCLYCDTWDGDFWIDRHPQRPGVVVATGGSGHGFKFAPMLGPLIADVVEGKPNRFAHRFAWRARGEIKTEEARHS
jgi:glycine/D-amino acid oxidase-like deaminating enzyme